MSVVETDDVTALVTVSALQLRILEALTYTYGRPQGWLLADLSVAVAQLRDEPFLSDLLALRDRKLIRVELDSTERMTARLSTGGFNVLLAHMRNDVPRTGRRRWADA